MQRPLGERGKHLKPKASGMAVGKDLSRFIPEQDSISLHIWPKKNKHSIDISLENRFHNKAKFHQS